jgi:hypothetical protein
MITVLALLGLGIGSLAQPLYDKGIFCHEQGQPMLSCIFFPSQ